MKRVQLLFVLTIAFLFYSINASAAGKTCVMTPADANAVVFLNASTNCTTNTDFTFLDSGTVAQLLLGGGSTGLGGVLTLRTPTFGAVNFNAPQLSSGDASWFSFQGRAASFGASSSGGNLGFSQNNNVGPQTITAISRSSDIVTVTFTAAFNSVFPVNSQIAIAGVTDSTYDCGRCRVLTSAAGTLTFSQTGANSSSSGGTVSFFAGNAVSSTNGSGQLALLGSAGGYGKNLDGSYTPAIEIIATGTAVNSTSGGDIFISGGGSHDTGTDATEPAGNVDIQGGSAVGGDNNGGSINLTAGSASGTGVPGVIVLNSNTELNGAALVTLGVTTVNVLPSASAHAGAMIRVSDSTTVATEGQMCAGGGSSNAIAISNGSEWKCF